MVGCFFPDFVLFFSRVVIYEVSCKVMYPRFRAAAAVAFFFDAERFTATDNTYEVRGFLVTYIIFLFSIFYNNIIQSIYTCRRVPQTQQNIPCADRIGPEAPGFREPEARLATLYVCLCNQT